MVCQSGYGEDHHHQRISGFLKPGDEPFYPLNDEKNNALYARYQDRARSEDKVRFCGRLGEYRYYDMDQAAAAALALAEQLLHPQELQEAQ